MQVLVTIGLSPLPQLVMRAIGQNGKVASGIATILLPVPLVSPGASDDRYCRP